MACCASLKQSIERLLASLAQLRMDSARFGNEEDWSFIAEVAMKGP